MFGFGPVSVGYLAKTAHLAGLSASIRVTTLFFLAVYLVVAALGALLRVRNLTIKRLWRMLPAKARLHLALAGASNALSGWCFFDMLDRIDPLSAAVVMALAIIFNFIAARLLLGEEIGLKTPAGRTKWLAFALILAGVLLTSFFSSLIEGSGGVPTVRLSALLVGFASSLFAAIRTVTVKGALNALPRERVVGMRVGPALAVTRFVYLLAFGITLVVASLLALLDPAVAFTPTGVLLPNPFMAELGLVYGGAYALNYIAMSRIEASRMALITRSSIVFTACYMVIASAALGIGHPPSIVQAPSALLVIVGAYLATRRRSPPGSLPPEGCGS